MATVVVPDTPLAGVLHAWARYAELRAMSAPLAERLAAWSALQDARRDLRHQI